jgi:hypothetical protein
VHHGQLEAIQWSARGWRYSEAAVEAFAQSMAAPARREAS